jgi:hypothetical protein
MTVAEAIGSVRYVVDANGEKTDAIVPLAVWKTLLAVWQQSVRLVEDHEDQSLLRDWLQRREAGEIDMIPLEDLEQELRADGLL